MVELGLGKAEEITTVEPLTGGVASDIARVRVGERDICVKFALPKLKVAEDWQAPIHRNAAEYAWLKSVSDLFPENSVALYGRSDDLHGFAMEYLSGDKTYLWKAALLSEAPDQGEAKAVGDMLGRIHAASTQADFDTEPFQNANDFFALRLEPYLSFTAKKHPDLPMLWALADRLYNSRSVLVHGDVSPKNIFFRGAAPIILDAECATMGDDSFDPAFCLNHLVLKSIHLPKSHDRLLGNVLTFWGAYKNHVDWEDPAQLEARICQLLPALMLARIDGKSPVEYLGEVDRTIVRKLSRALIIDACTDLTEFTTCLVAHKKELVQ